MNAPPSGAPDLAGRIFGNQFRLEGRLGRGGMGEVYRAEQLELGRTVVIKLLTSAPWPSLELEERFRREARVLAQLNHPNIVQLYSFGRTEDGITYLALEYIEGQTLTQRIAEHGAMPESLVLSILDQICDALVEAHGRGIVHRDLKPDNVMTTLRRGQDAFVKVLDFGIAKLVDARAHDPRLTRSGAILGTPQYMAPEQIREQPVDARADIYALGLIGYELLTGQVPFTSDNTLELMMLVVNEPPPPPSRKSGGVRVSAATEALIMKCLAKDPAQRFASALELREALAAVARASSHPPQPSAAREVHRPSLTLDARDLDVTLTSIRPRARRTASAAAAVLFLFAGLAAAVYALATVGQAVLDPALESSSSAASSGAPPALREWVQGMPFPHGTEYLRFEPELVDATVAAPTDQVLAFYRAQLGAKWTLVEVESGLAIQQDHAPIETLTVTPHDAGSRVLIRRRVGR